jgi:flagellar hook-associated protein 1 FlgK
MSVLFGVLSIGRHAFAANQRALAVTAQNIANLNTPGYARQEVIFGSFATAHGEVPTDHQGAQGMGVIINGIRRAGGIGNTVLENRISAGLASLGRFGAEEATFNRIESLFNDTNGTGLNQLFSDFFNALQDVANSPDDLAVRGTLITRADTLASAFVSTDRKLQDLVDDINLEIGTEFTNADGGTESTGLLGEINAQTELIARLNDEIATATASGLDVGELKNQRLLIMNSLSEKIGFVAEEDPLNLGKVDIVVNTAEGSPALTLVSAGDAQTLSQAVALKPSDITPAVLGGIVGGLANMRDVVIPGFLADLDNLAENFISEINAQHRAGTDRNGIPAGDFFAGDSAATMELLIDDPTQIAASASLLTGTVSTTFSTVPGTTNLPTNLIVGVGTAFTTELEVGESIIIGANTYTVSSVISDTELLLTESAKVSVAGATATYAMPLNNRNALKLSLLQGTDIDALGPASFQEFYESLVSKIGVKSQAADFKLSAENVVQGEIEEMKAQTSGVSLEEELINIMKYQRAAEAAARLVSVADELLGTLIGLGQ